MLYSNSLLDSTVDLGEKLLETQDILTGGETLHPARKLLKFGGTIRKLQEVHETNWTH